MKSVLLGALLGGIVVFLWGAVTHTVLFSPEKAGIYPLPHEEELVGSLRAALGRPGFYAFPWVDQEHATPEAEAAWEARYRSGPLGMVLWHPQGRAPLAPTQLLLELASNVLGALIAAFALRCVVCSYFGRALLVASLGLFAWLATDVSYWNWHGFPVAFTTAAAADAVVGWLLAGLVMARVVKRAA